MSRLRRAALVLALALTAALPGQAQQAGQAPKAQAAGYMVLDSAEVPVMVTLTGRAVAQNATQVRPRVGGAVTAILYTPGSLVEAGTPLFSLDPLTHKAALAAAEAEAAGARADLAAAQTAFDRAERLRATAASSDAAWEATEAALLKAQAALAAAEADVNLARAELDWTTLRAPIRGIAGVPQVALGDLVTQNQTAPLAEIVQTDPVLVDLTEPYATRLRIEARAEKGEVVLEEPALALILEDGRRIEGAAKMLSEGATVSASTGTRLLRFEVENPAGLIAPGMFLHAELTLGTQPAILVPQRAAQRERDGSLSAWIAVEGKAVKRRLTEAGTHGNAWIVLAGLAPGDWLLVDGIANLKEGQEVAPVPAQIDDMGVVRDAAAVGN